MRWWISTKSEKDIEKVIEERLKAIDLEMKRILLEENPFLLPERWYRDDPVVQSIWPSGKRIRPLLCLFSCETVCGEWRKALPTSAGIEFLHTFTLVHDDIMDRSFLRRGRPTVYSEWGDSIAIAAGDTLYSLAFKSFLRNIGIEGVTYEQVKKIMDIAVKKCFSLAKGQTMDLLSEKSEDMTLDDYVKMAELKTSSLMELSLIAGAIIGGANNNEINFFENIGKELGQAYQIQDDILDIEGIEIGKPTGLDLQRKKKTIILIHAMKNADESDREVLRDFLKGKRMNTNNLIEIFKRAGSIDFAKKKAREHFLNAKTKIQMLEDNKGKRHLEKLVDYMMNRTR